MNTRISYGAGLLVALLLIINLFFHVASTPVAEWDEARHIASAVEMVHSHHYLVNTYQGLPDYWNAKPPLSMWGAAAGYSLLPDPFMGVRLFTTVSVLLTLFMVWHYARRLAGVPAAFLAVLMLLTSASFIYRHGARTADPDMLFVALTTVALLCFSRATALMMALGYAALGLAFLTKSFHAAPYCMAAFAYTVVLWRQQRLPLAMVMLLPFAFLLPVLPWAVERFQADGTRFFDMMFFNDVVKRTSQDIIDDHGPTTPLMYIPKLAAAFAVPFICAVIALRRQWAPAPWREPARYLLLLWIIIPLVLYSAAQTRLPWYAFPLFPAIAVLLSAVLAEKWQGLSAGAQRGFAIALVISLVANEAVILQRVQAAHKKDPVAVAMLKLANTPGNAGDTIFLEPDAAQWRQHYYASSLLMGATLEHGGEKAFEQAPLAEKPLLIRADGTVVHRSGPQVAAIQ